MLRRQGRSADDGDRAQEGKDLFAPSSQHLALSAIRFEVPAKLAATVVALQTGGWPILLRLASAVNRRAATRVAQP
jgi:hypothetical protein